MRHGYIHCLNATDVPTDGKTAAIKVIKYYPKKCVPVIKIISKVYFLVF